MQLAVEGAWRRGEKNLERILGVFATPRRKKIKQQRNPGIADQLGQIFSY
jgi:hypothetical protein